MTGAELQLYVFIAWMIGSMILFIAIIAWALWPSNRQRFESYGSIPLADDQPETRP
jgi:cbb3-type cytochrome oxidase subunit 3